MVISAIKYNSFLFIDAHAEQSYTGSFLADKGDFNTNVSQGIYGQELTKETLLNILEYILAGSQELTVIIDCSSIRDIQSNQQEQIKAIKKYVKLLILTNVSEAIVVKLGIDIYANNVISDGVCLEFHVADNVEDVSYPSYEELFTKKFEDLLKANVLESEPKKAFRKNSPIYITKFIDVKGMLVSDREFFLYVIYRLAVGILDREIWSKHLYQPILFCQNLNGAFIASVLSSFLQWDLLTMDHIGPVNKMYSNIGNKIKNDGRYLVISDMVCLGTEIRICQNIINYSGGHYLGNASIVRVDTLVPEHQEKDIISVYHINHDNNPVNYKILTALDITSI
jgi:hypothetical protein